MRAWWTGATLVALGLAWLIADQVLQALFPLSWGGPNIGGGLIILIAMAAAVAGLLMLLRAGPNLAQHQPRPSRLLVLAPLAVDGALVLALVAVRVVLSGDAGP